MKNKGIDGTEGGGIDADPYRERKYRGQRESGIIAQRPQRVSKIAAQLIEPGQTAGFTAAFLVSFHGAKLDTGLALCFACGESGPHEMFRTALDMEA